MTDDLFSWKPPPLPSPPKAKAFDGPVYEPKRDHDRLRGQLLRVFGLMKDGRWRSNGEIARITGDPENSISAQLRHLRKPRYGSHTVEKKHHGDGFWRYRLIVNEEKR